jgi:hypothetical protein
VGRILAFSEYLLVALDNYKLRAKRKEDFGQVKLKKYEE